MKALKAFREPFEAPKRSAKIKFNLIFISIERSEMHGTGRVKCGNWKLLFPKIYNMHNFKLFCPSGLTIVALHVTIKRVNFFHIVFHDTTLKN